MLPTSTIGKVAAVLVAGLVLTVAGLGAAVSTGVVTTDPPAVESIDNEWGEVTDERTAIRTTVVVDNPNGVPVPGVASVDYDVTMNDVTVAEGSSGGLDLAPGRNEVALETHIDNDRIPAWWASHVNNGERTELSVRPTLDAPGISRELPATTQTFETDILSSFESDESRSVAVGDRTLLTVERTEASWGTATENRTPLSFAATVDNPGDAPLRFSRLGYAVSMNDVTVAEGTTDGTVEIPAGETGTVEIDAALDNRKLDEWWASHLRNDERTTLDVTVFAVVETDEGTRRVPLPFLGQRAAFETDILGGGEATTRAIETDDGVGIEPPTVAGVERDWTTTDAGTRFSTRVAVDAPENGSIPIDLDARYRTSLNDVTVVDVDESASLEPGRNELVFEDEVGDGTVKRWWASHVNNGERTDLRTHARGTADLGFAELPVELPADNRTFETDMLGGFEEGDQSIQVRGRTVGTFSGLNATWGEATVDRTPMVTSGTVENRAPRPLTVVSLGYEVRMNDVVLADNETRIDETVPRRSTREIAATGYLDNDRVPDWWASHLERGERSELSVSYYAVVEIGGERHRVDLDDLSYNRTVTTDAFGES